MSKRKVLLCIFDALICLACFALALFYGSLSFGALCCLCVFSARLAYRLARRPAVGKSECQVGIAIVGTGDVGVSLARELLDNPVSRCRPVCFLEPSQSSEEKRTLCGLPVYGSDADVTELTGHLKIDEIVIALPKLSGENKAKLYSTYRDTGCKIKIYDFPVSNSGPAAKKRSLRDISIEELIFRDSTHIANRLSEDYYKGKTVLVTGGGGSVGSELCRRIAKLSPRMLAIFDIYENNAYDIEQELRRTYGDKLELKVYIGSVCDAARLDEVFAEVKPDIVFHAAAYKHVPYMEMCPAEAVRNNIFGTYNTVCAAERHTVSKFVLISTDKAVNPTGVMGATKRFCEMIVCSRSGSVTHFAAVRFGNVIGSNGSVVPLFKKQIENGGPVTVTDKRVVRYFMTVSEAAELVLEAGAMAHHGELYVLDMGNPVKIWDIAVNMISLAGLEAGRDIEIKEIGLRPGEKLYEELLVKPEQVTRTENSLIFIEKDTPLPKGEVEEKLEKLREAVKSGGKAVTAALKEAVPTFAGVEKAE